MNDLSVTLHYFYVFVMLSGAFYFYTISKKTEGVPKYEYLVATLIPLWSGAAYLSIALGQGLLEKPEKTIYFARYIDWVVTTPMLLIALAFTAMFFEKKNKTLIISLVFADVFMILTGLIADFSSENIKYIWYLLGVVALFIILYIIWYPLRKIAVRGGKQLSSHYTRTAAYLTVFWISYPTVWLLGPSGLGLAQATTELIAFIFLPIFSKVGFSILDLNGLRHLEKGRAL
ncbi:bacteriorhodopsin [Bacillus weihaiensis]|uniref:Lactococcin n=2 Tax=Bacillus weihaiensis TaxID=1547283 RepID=A0A1L3MLR8_9BACI|nr:bacteriorhodopsin [Bacillus weihaiensis]APH03280.1 hypothetical protein A9C19_00095 [Bacillus weihaiensis]